MAIKCEWLSLHAQTLLTKETIVQLLIVKAAFVKQ